jgi:hypothetical protein
MTFLTYSQRVFLALSRSVSALLSWIASWIIVYKIVFRYRDNRRYSGVNRGRNSNSSSVEITAYHRILLGTSFLDILHTTWAAMSTLPVPASTGVVFGRGTTATCSAQGFFIQLSAALPIYMAALNTYFMLKIRYNVSDDVIRRKYEPWFHLVPLTHGFTTASAGVGLKIFNPIIIPELGCWIARYPPLCDVFGGCTRGYKLDKYLDLYAWIFSYGWLFASFIVVLVNSILIYTAIRKQEQRNERYRFELDSDATGFKQNTQMFQSSLKPAASSTKRKDNITTIEPSHCMPTTTTGYYDQLKPLDNSSICPLQSELPCEDSAILNENDKGVKNNQGLESVLSISERNSTSEVSIDTAGRNKKHSDNISSLETKVRLSRIAAFQSLLFCSSTLFVAFWIFMPWVAVKIHASEKSIFFIIVMLNIVNASQGMFNLFIMVRLQYNRLRTVEKWSRLRAIKTCIFSTDIN